MSNDSEHSAWGAHSWIYCDLLELRVESDAVSTTSAMYHRNNNVAQVHHLKSGSICVSDGWCRVPALFEFCSQTSSCDEDRRPTSGSMLKTHLYFYSIARHENTPPKVVLRVEEWEYLDLFPTWAVENVIDVNALERIQKDLQMCRLPELEMSDFEDDPTIQVGSSSDLSSLLDLMSPVEGSSSVIDKSPVITRQPQVNLKDLLVSDSQMQLLNDVSAWKSATHQQQSFQVSSTSSSDESSIMDLLVVKSEPHASCSKKPSELETGFVVESDQKQVDSYSFGQKDIPKAGNAVSVENFAREASTLVADPGRPVIKARCDHKAVDPDKNQVDFGCFGQIDTPEHNSVAMSPEDSAAESLTVEESAKSAGKTQYDKETPWPDKNQVGPGDFGQETISEPVDMVPLKTSCPGESTLIMLVDKAWCDKKTAERDENHAFEHECISGSDSLFSHEASSLEALVIEESAMAVGKARCDKKTANAHKSHVDFHGFKQKDIPDTNSVVSLKDSLPESLTIQEALEPVGKAQYDENIAQPVKPQIDSCGLRHREIPMCYPTVSLRDFPREMLILLEDNKCISNEYLKNSKFFSVTEHDLNTPRTKSVNKNTISSGTFKLDSVTSLSLNTRSKSRGKLRLKKLLSNTSYSKCEQPEERQSCSSHRNQDPIGTEIKVVDHKCHAVLRIEASPSGSLMCPDPEQSSLSHRTVTPNIKRRKRESSVQKKTTPLKSKNKLSTAKTNAFARPSSSVVNSGFSESQSVEQTLPHCGRLSSGDSFNTLVQHEAIANTSYGCQVSDDNFEFGSSPEAPGISSRPRREPRSKVLRSNRKYNGGLAHVLTFRGRGDSLTMNNKFTRLKRTRQEVSCISELTTGSCSATECQNREAGVSNESDRCEANPVIAESQGFDYHPLIHHYPGESEGFLPQLSQRDQDFDQEYT